MMNNRHISYSEKECGSNNSSLHFVDFSDMHNCDRSSNAIQSNLAYKMYKNIARSRLFCSFLGSDNFGKKFSISATNLMTNLVEANPDNKSENFYTNNHQSTLHDLCQMLSQIQTLSNLTIMELTLDCAFFFQPVEYEHLGHMLGYIGEVLQKELMSFM